MMNRRDFVANVTVGGAFVLGSRFLPPLLAARPEGDDDVRNLLAYIEGEDARKITLAAIDALGGMKKFVKQGDVVLVKPNIGWDRTPDQAANTNPMVVAAVVEACKAAGAKEILVLDRTCNESRRCYQRSGIEEAAKTAGADVVLFDAGRARNYTDVTFKNGKKVTSWPILKRALEANVFINVPVAKHHGISGLTLGMKNLMGLMGGERGKIHKEIHQSLADLVSGVRPHLTIIDAYRILLRHGPQGGKLEDVKLAKTVIACADIVAADACAASLPGFDKKPAEVGFIKSAADMGLGEIDWTKKKVIRKTID